MLPEEVTKFIGQAGSVKVFEVEKGAIKRFADAIDDPNLLYWDEEYARNSRYGSLIAPPGFFGWPAKLPRGAPLTSASELMVNLRPAITKAGYPRSLDGGIDYEFFHPVRAGDTLAVSSMIKDIIGREGKTGKLVFVITETTYTNQNGDLVARARGTSIFR